MAFTMQPPPTFPPTDPPPTGVVADSDFITLLLSRKRRLTDRLEALPQSRPPHKAPRGIARLAKRSCGKAAVVSTETAGGTAAAAAEPIRIPSADWDKQWSFEIGELRTKPREPKARRVKRKDVAARVISTLAQKEGEEESELEEGTAAGEDEVDVVVDEEDDEEEPGDYTMSYFDNGEEEPNDDTEREDE
mmetsp:Transcript_5172/g.13409  ORF Transcript_5172/g.13409 Transcript_5172/m.13409 type:complete len:191 (+) Transcript_5172:90-662(+)|eukprot:CAMPEP_0206292178 /NCGR_PEP_ID=MMETSP0106_2-20121207/3496_1 /ASSEMBLY_ACC=CAM_ASM_000206 /TAXON_ID=81532 /ORGANISM="Acanthoeca-like sp., Strain 10tr" /LENGTH=190 /DNA_ID=CAMNT_0053722751 /DNA_START=1 /DNA_END=573 /DNA_ORIENTATION=+